VPRLLLILALIGGLIPSLGEAVEVVVHYATTGHMAHSPGETDLGDLGTEHGCGPMAHFCRCCPSQHVLPPVAPRQAVGTRERDASMRGPEQKMALGVHRRLLRPPITT
jgi:hypothetical protein